MIFPHDKVNWGKIVTEMGFKDSLRTYFKKKYVSLR